MNILNKNKIPRRAWRRFTKTKIYNYIPDKWAVKIKYKNNFLKKLDLKNPVTFNEKLQWLKLYDRKKEYTTMVDKLAVKDYIAERIGKEYIIPTIGVWNTFDEIDFDSLPDKFVLKCTHGSGDTVICKDKNTFDKEEAKKKLEESLRTDYYLISREWPYKNVKRLIIAEEYIEDKTDKDTRDYKFMCFNGKVKCFLVVYDRVGDKNINWYNEDKKLLPYCREKEGNKRKSEINLPSKVSQMIMLAEQLAKDMVFLRVDFYYVNEKIYFGELTFYPAAGFLRFNDDAWDEQMGEWLTLPAKMIK